MSLVLFDQTVLTDHDRGTHGDCARACVATILQIDSSTLPHPIDAAKDTWNPAFYAALRALGYSLRAVDYDPREGGDVEIRDVAWFGYKVPRIVMAAGPTRRGTRHGVVWDRLASRMIHDPHPSRIGLERITDINYLAPFPKGTAEGTA